VTAAWEAHCGDLWRAHVLAATGRDICDVVGPSPRRPADWTAMMRRLGVRSMDGVLSAFHGDPITSRRAMRGDIVRRGWAIGVCRGDRAEFIGGEMVSMSEVDVAWRLQAAPHLAHDTTSRNASKQHMPALPSDDADARHRSTEIGE